MSPRAKKGKQQPDKRTNKREGSPRRKGRDEGPQRRLPPGLLRARREVGLPLVIQDEPSATGVLIPVSVLLASLRAGRSRAVKLEDPPTASKIARLLAEDPFLQVFGGLGGASALYELNRGACGTMTGFAFPEILAAIRGEHARVRWSAPGCSSTATSR